LLLPPDGEPPDGPCWVGAVVPGALGVEVRPTFRLSPHPLKVRASAAAATAAVRSGRCAGRVT